MSGGGAGPIIIRPGIRKVAATEAVQQNITPAECSVRDAILAKPDGDWTKAEFGTLLKLIRKAHNATC